MIARSVTLKVYRKNQIIKEAYKVDQLILIQYTCIKNFS